MVNVHTADRRSQTIRVRSIDIPWPAVRPTADSSEAPCRTTVGIDGDGDDDAPPVHALILEMEPLFFLNCTVMTARRLLLRMFQIPSEPIPMPNAIPIPMPKSTSRRVRLFFMNRIPFHATAAAGTGESGIPRKRRAMEKPEMDPKTADLLSRMVGDQIDDRGVRNRSVLRAMRSVPRRRFVPEAFRSRAYADEPLPIGFGQTISQPYIVAYMTEALGLAGDEKVLEIGTGSGYQTAVLAETSREVFSIEIIPQLAEAASTTLSDMGYANVFVRCADGAGGWPDQAPFDRIVLTAAPRNVPETLFDQLAEDGLLLAPVGEFRQELVLFARKGGGLTRQTLIPVRFVPLTGPAVST
jgi:protein-L-isoaspartate(D-aspartate) O-methyltransferase